jgi:hypothetical protein
MAMIVGGVVVPVMVMVIVAHERIAFPVITLHPLVPGGASEITKGGPIGEAARLGGVKAPTIRYCEEIGRQPCPARPRGAPARGAEKSFFEKLIGGEAAGVIEGLLARRKGFRRYRGKTRMNQVLR